MNAKLAELIEDRSERSWFKLFKHMDDDGSGKMSYIELSGMVREELHLTPQDLPEKTLKKVWLALDKDSSGCALSLPGLLLAFPLCVRVSPSPRHSFTSTPMQAHHCW